MKKCKGCGADKPLEDYYTTKSNTDGRFNKCKECIKQDVRSNRRRNIEYYREYDRVRANNPDRVRARKDYTLTPRGIEARNRAKLAWNERNRFRRRVFAKVNNAVRDGIIDKSSECETCGKTDCRIEGHHCDYAKPLDVMWLCSQCHRNWHKEHSEGLKGE